MDVYARDFVWKFPQYKLFCIIFTYLWFVNTCNDISQVKTFLVLLRMLCMREENSKTKLKEKSIIVDTCTVSLWYVCFFLLWFKWKDMIKRSENRHITREKKFQYLSNHSNQLELCMVIIIHFDLYLTLLLLLQHMYLFLFIQL